MSEKKYSPEDVLKILRVCGTSAPCSECPMTEHDCANSTHAMLGAAAIEELLKKRQMDEDLMQEQAERIGELEEKLEVQRWVPVGERLPDAELDEIAKHINLDLHYPGFQCLAMILDAKHPTIMNYADIDGERVWVDDEGCCYPVTHWRPMPEVPGEEGLLMDGEGAK